MPEPSKVSWALVCLGEEGLAELATAALQGHALVGIQRLQADPVRLKGVLAAALADPRIQAVVVVGGEPVELVESMFDRALPGFREVYRYLAFAEIGSEAMFCRACAGFARGRALICLPGGTQDVARGLERLVAPQFSGLVEEARHG